jgi:hypothetical protein
MLAVASAAWGRKNAGFDPVPPPKPTVVDQLITPDQNPMQAALQAAWGMPSLVRKKRKTDQQRARRHEDMRCRKLVQASPVSLAHADALVSSLMASPRGRKMIPRSSTILEGVVRSVKDEVADAMGGVFRRMKKQNRFRGSIVHELCTRSGRHFTVAEWEDICEVASGYTNRERQREKERVERKSTRGRDPLFSESMRGFPAEPRKATAATEKEVVVDWARNAMVVRSGTHRETFRLQIQKQRLIEDFHCAYPRLLRRMNRENNVMRATFATTERDFSLFHRNMEYALWVANQPGFVEGADADEVERQKLKQRQNAAVPRGKVASPHAHARTHTHGTTQKLFPLFVTFDP